MRMLWSGVAVAMLCAAMFTFHAVHADDMLVLGGERSHTGEMVTYLGDEWSANASGVSV